MLNTGACWAEWQHAAGYLGLVARYGAPTQGLTRLAIIFRPYRGWVNAKRHQNAFGARAT